MSTAKLEDNTLWQKAARIAEKSYALLSDFPEEEKWGMQSKLRQRAYEASNDVAEAMGAIDPRDVKWHLGLARRDLFGLKNTLILSSKAGYTDLDPNLLDDIEKSIDEIDDKIQAATRDIPNWFKEMQAPENVT